MVKHYSTSQLCPKPSAAIHGPTQTSDSEAGNLDQRLRTPVEPELLPGNNNLHLDQPELLPNNLFVLNGNVLFPQPLSESRVRNIAATMGKPEKFAWSPERQLQRNLVTLPWELGPLEECGRGITCLGV